MPVGDKIKEFLRTKAPSLVHKIGEFLPEKGALGIIRNIILSATPEEVAPIHKNEGIEIIDKELELLDKELADVKDARDLQKTALNQTDNFSKRYLYMLASLVVLSATGFGVALMFVSIPKENQRLIEMFADIFLFAGAMMVLQFFFGSSHGSEKKTEVMQEMIKQTQDQKNG